MNKREHKKKNVVRSAKILIAIVLFSGCVFNFLSAEELEEKRYFRTSVHWEYIDGVRHTVVENKLLTNFFEGRNRYKGYEVINDGVYERFSFKYSSYKEMFSILKNDFGVIVEIDEKEKQIFIYYK